MIVKNIGYNPIDVGIGSNRARIKPGETKEVDDALVQVILNSYRKDDLEMVSHALDMNQFLRLEEV